jgi:hypothetical protein
MMFEAETPQGKITWLSDLDDPFFGSPIVILRLKQCATEGLQAAWPAEPVVIDLRNPGDVRFALETIYKDGLTFSLDAPEASVFYEPVEGPDIQY